MSGQSPDRRITDYKKVGKKAGSDDRRHQRHDDGIQLRKDKRASM